MIQWCCSKFHFGDRVFGEKEPLDDRRKTHGICRDCFQKECENMKRQAEMPRERPHSVIKERKGR